MNEKKKSPWYLLNPLCWLDAVTGLFSAIFGPLLRFLGFMQSTPPSGPREALHVSDVADAARDAASAHEAIDELVNEMSPAEVLHAYARASEDDRKSMDLSALSEEQQVWLMRLSDIDMIFLANESIAGCERSLNALQVFRLKRRRTAEVEAPAVLSTKTPMTEEEKADFIRHRFAELFIAPGVGNPSPRYVPETRH